MSQCKDCNRTFSYQEVLKSACGIIQQKKLTCTQCGKEYKISVLSRLIVIGVSLLVGIITALTTESVVNRISIIVLYLIAVMLVSPFLVRHSEVSKDELC